MDTRSRILSATDELLREVGYNGMSLQQIISLASATPGSVYHFFPGGKEQLATTVVRKSGVEFRTLVQAILEAEEDLSKAVERVFCDAAKELEGIGYVDLCPVGSIAREVASTDSDMQSASADVFADWIKHAHKHFMRAGMPDVAARDFAITFIATLEGSFILARTLRSPEPLHAAASSLSLLAQTILNAKKRKRRPKRS